jgi:hypothetical protein
MPMELVEEKQLKQEWHSPTRSKGILVEHVDCKPIRYITKIIVTAVTMSDAVRLESRTYVLVRNFGFFRISNRVIPLPMKPINVKTITTANFRITGFHESKLGPRSIK